MLRCTLWFKKGFLIPVSSLCPFTLCCKSCSVKRQSIDFLKILNTNRQYKVRNVAELQPRVQSHCVVFWGSSFLYMGTRLPILPKKSTKILLSNPVILMSYWDRISSNNINTITSRQVLRKEKNINLGNFIWSNTKLSKLTSKELYGRQ